MRLLPTVGGSSNRCWGALHTKRMWGILCAVSFGTGCDAEPFVSDATLASPNCGECHGRQTPDHTFAEIVGDIVDTHFDNQHINHDGDFIVEDTPQYEGYVFAAELPWAEAGTGYVVAGAEDACAASCHDGHDGDSLIGRQWRNSSHGDVNAHTFNFEFPAGVCLQCHHSAGYAYWQSPANFAFPGFIPPEDELWGHMVTCNACHDGTSYPTAEDAKLRYADDAVTMVSGSVMTDSAVRDATVTVPGGASTCMTCHQGRNSGASTYKRMIAVGADPYAPIPPNMVFGVPFADIDSHGGHAGANLYSLKGYEYPGKTYTNGNILHQTATCIGCHMAESDDEGVGGHTMKPTGCERCHGIEWEEFDHAGRLMDVDGDGVAGYPKAEVEGLKQRIIDELAAGDIYYDPTHFPFFFGTDDPEQRTFGDTIFVWQEQQMLAAFNLHFVKDDPGIFVHNYRYAAQLLRDSYEDLTGSTLDGVRPATPEDRPAIDYSTF